MGWPGYINQPPVIKFNPDILAREMAESGLSDVRVDGIYPWKALFFWPPWYKRNKFTEHTVYLIGRILDKIPLHEQLRSRFALQILAVGRKP